MSDQKIENLKFKIGISGIYWDKKPKYQILLDGNVVVEGEISAQSGEIEYHEFSHDFDVLADKKNHSLSLRFLNKTPDQTVKASDYSDSNMSIEKDMLLVIENLEIDGVDIPVGADHGPHDRYGIYHVDEPVAYHGQDGVKSINGVRHMGWNGQYIIEFQVPFYIWLLENL